MALSVWLQSFSTGSKAVKGVMGVNGVTGLGGANSNSGDKRPSMEAVRVGMTRKYELRLL